MDPAGHRGLLIMRGPTQLDVVHLAKDIGSWARTEEYSASWHLWAGEECGLPSWM